jgi:hypothetical protein
MPLLSTIDIALTTSVDKANLMSFKESATMKMPRFAVLAALLAALLLGVLASAAQEERVLVIGHAESTDSYDPARGFTQTTGFVNRVTYQTLVTFPDEDASEILPLLATSWEVSEDGLTYTFTLNPTPASPPATPSLRRMWSSASTALRTSRATRPSSQT